MTEVNDLRKSIQGKSNYLWLIDAGHGGMLNGEYVTAPAKMFTFPDGLTIYEGVVNRQIANLVALKLTEANIDFQFIHDPEEDTSLPVRVLRADASFHKDKRAVLVSLHSNAGGGRGFEIFTSKGQTKSDKIAEVFCKKYKTIYPYKPFRSDGVDGDFDKEGDLYLLRKTDCPAILIENLFFDDYNEAQYLLSKEGQNSIASCIVMAVIDCETLKPI